jgi:hypothetical protein
MAKYSFKKIKNFPAPRMPLQNRDVDIVPPEKFIRQIKAVRVDTSVKRLKISKHVYVLVN